MRAAVKIRLLLVAFADGFLDLLSRLGCGLFLVWRMEIEINPAQRSRVIVLAQDHRDLTIECNPMPELRAATFVSLDGLGEERHERGVKLVRRFVDADNVLLVYFHRFRDFRLESLRCHASSIKSIRKNGSKKSSTHF